MEKEMEVEMLVHMNGGEGEDSYAQNSLLQKLIIQKAKHTIDECIKQMYSFEDLPECINIADLGCSSGPNAFLSVENIINTIFEMTSKTNRTTPRSIHLFLNDLVGNDFNSLFKLLPDFYQRVGRSCFVTAVPGSFYGRLFPPNYVHFVHASCSLMWLSQILPAAAGCDLGSAYGESGQITLNTIKGSWPVLFCRVNGSICFYGEGWRHFVVEHDLSYGECLHFEPLQPYNIAVIIFTTGGVEKTFSDDQVIEEYVPMASFQISVPSYSVEQSYIQVPLAFAAANDLRVSKEAHLRNQRGELWFAQLQCSTYDRTNRRQVRLKEMADFMKDNNVQVGQELKFELYAQYTNEVVFIVTSP